MTGKEEFIHDVWDSLLYLYSREKHGPPAQYDKILVDFEDLKAAIVMATNLNQGEGR